MAEDRRKSSFAGGTGGILVVGLIILFVIILFSFLRNLRVYTSYEVESRISRGDDSSVYYMVLPYGLARYSSNGVALTDREGNLLWNQTYGMDEPLACAGDTYFAIGGLGSGTVLVFSQAGQCGSITTDEPVRSLCISDQGVIAAQLEDKDSNYIDLFDRTGNRLASIKASAASTGFVQALDISPDGKSLAVSYLKVDAGKLQTKAALYSFGKDQEDGRNEIYTEVTDGLCPKVEFLSDTQAVFYYEDGFRVFETGSQPGKTAEITFEEEIRSVFSGSQKTGFIFRDPEGSGRYLVRTYDARGRAASEFYFDLDYTRISCVGEILTVYNDSRAQAFTLEGRKRMDLSFDETVTSIMPSWKQRAYWVAGESSLSEIRLK